MLEQELRQRDDRLGPTHPDTLLSVTCLAMLLQAQGELGGAKPLYERALRGFEEKYGPTHRDTLISVNNLAVLLKAMGELGEARPLYERVLAGDEEQLGPKHPHTLDSVYNLARLYHVAPSEAVAAGAWWPEPGGRGPVVQSLVAGAVQPLGECGASQGECVAKDAMWEAVAG